jgi:hypothetical protein
MQNFFKAGAEVIIAVLSYLEICKSLESWQEDDVDFAVISGSFLWRAMEQSDPTW